MDEHQHTSTRMHCSYGERRAVAQNSAHTPVFNAVNYSQFEFAVVVHDSCSLSDADARCDGNIPDGYMRVD